MTSFLETTPSAAFRLASPMPQMLELLQVHQQFRLAQDPEDKAWFEAMASRERVISEIRCAALEGKSYVDIPFNDHPEQELADELVGMGGGLMVRKMEGAVRIQWANFPVY